jgi:hypothetical protein
VALGLRIPEFLAGKACKLTHVVSQKVGADYGTSVNWYQRNYPYVWAGARIVRDL